MNLREAKEAKPECYEALPAVLEHKRPFRFLDADGNETDAEHGSGAPNLDSRATIVCRLKMKVANLPPEGGQCYVIDDSDCPLGLKP